VKLTYNALLEKAETREKERLKEEAKKMRKVEGELRFVFSHRAGSWLSFKGQNHKIFDFNFSLAFKQCCGSGIFVQIRILHWILFRIPHIFFLIFLT
jgi:hypothetical protein